MMPVGTGSRARQGASHGVQRDALQVPPLKLRIPSPYNAPIFFALFVSRLEEEFKQ